MEWKTKYKNGDKIIKSSFLLFPKTLKGKTRWLCFAKWEREFRESILDSSPGYYWIDLNWVD